MQKQNPILVIVCGGSGSGKTTIAQSLVKNLGDKLQALVVCQDNFYNSNEHLDLDKRALQNFDHPNAFNWELMYETLQKLLSSQSVTIPEYDYQTHSSIPDAILVQPHDVIIFEGIYGLFDPRINELAALKIYVDTPADERLIRRLERDIVHRKRTLESVVAQ